MSIPSMFSLLTNSAMFAAKASLLSMMADLKVKACGASVEYAHPPSDRMRFSGNFLKSAH